MSMLTIFGLWGSVRLPGPLNNLYSSGGNSAGGAFGVLINIFLNLLVMAAGIFALFNFILAGYGFLSAGGDSRKVADASAKIYMSIIGVVVAAGSLVLGAIVSKLIFGDYSTLLRPSIPTP